MAGSVGNVVLINGQFERVILKKACNWLLSPFSDTVFGHNGFVNPPILSRRNLLALSAGLPAGAYAQPERAVDGYVDILRLPSLAIAFLESGPLPLAREGHRWNGAGISVQTEPDASGMPVRIEAPEAPLLRLHLRWRAAVPERWRILNDQWERSYGDLEWRGVAFRSRPERRDARESPSRSFSCLCTCVQKYECLDSRLPGRW